MPQQTDHALKERAPAEWSPPANMTAAALFEAAIRRGEGAVAAGGALAVTTGAHTGRSPRDKYIVEDDATREHVWWEANNRMSVAQFDLLAADFMAHARRVPLFEQDLAIGAEPERQVRVRVSTELAWHALFARNLLIRPEDPGAVPPALTIIDVPSFRADPKRHGVRSETVIACDFRRGLILIGGTSYAGEIKKAAFTYLNFRLPAEGVMPMHCSANVGPAGDVAIFFGLSGTGKTTLSADPNRTLIGDDEHGWSDEGVFNFEGGCYAKTIHLSPEAEPQIHAATRRFGTVLENVVLTAPSSVPDFDDASLTENGRAAYQLDVIANASVSGRAGHPKNVVLLTADAFGVMPPIARLSPAEAIYHFLSGYTAKVAGTERGVTEPSATFSTCFGAPFMPRHPAEYGRLLETLIERHGATCWLVNTGWTGGPYGVGKRMPIAATRALLSAALDGSLNSARFRREPAFGFSIPEAVPGVDARLLTPRETWADKDAYDAQAKKLAKMFAENFRRFEKDVGADVLAAGPHAG
ncbi:MAG: phosphoenolpyruvate carboxykinase [Bauldia sp.]